MTEQNELERVLAECARRSAVDAAPMGVEAEDVELLQDAARLLREMAADFERHSCHATGCGVEEPECSCGIFEKKDRWRLR